MEYWRQNNIFFLLPLCVGCERASRHNYTIISIVITKKESHSHKIPPIIAATSPDVEVIAGAYDQVSVLTQKHRAHTAHMAPEHGGHLLPGRYTQQTHGSVLGAHGHQRAASVMYGAVRVLPATDAPVTQRTTRTVLSPCVLL